MTNEPVVISRRALKIGRSRYIAIPLEWIRAHDISEDDLQKLLVVADKDIRIVHPDHRAEVYKEVSKIVKEVKTK
jgi:hypothetical protein